VEVRASTSCTSRQVSSGCASTISATTPLTSGVAKEVPMPPSPQPWGGLMVHILKDWSVSPPGAQTWTAAPRDE
jgi:hypothetical protein